MIDSHFCAGSSMEEEKMRIEGDKQFPDVSAF